MVLDSLSNSSKYEVLHPAFKKAFDFIKNTDFSKINPGIIEIDGKDLFINFAQITGKVKDDAKMETHNEYIDIQITYGANEIMGYIPASELKSPEAPYNAEKDITFFKDKATTFIDVKIGQFVIFFPEDGHQPRIGDGSYTKIIVKVKLK